MLLAKYLEKKVKLLFTAVPLVLLAGCSSLAGSATKEAEEHAAHHPEGTAAAPAPAGYDQQMKMMQEMHQKMAAAKTPEERATLMKDHMKTMQDGMGMMGHARGNDGQQGDGQRQGRNAHGAGDDEAPHGHDGNDDADDGRPRGDEGPDDQVALRPKGASTWT